MQPLPTEAGPRSICAQCGEPLPAPNGTPTFVYGVGPVGYQSCAACGAKWRYLWQDAPSVRIKPERSRRAYLVVGGVVVGALVVVGVVALARSKPWNSDSAAAPTTSSTPATTGAPSDATALLSARSRFDPIATGMRTRRGGFMMWIVDNAPASSQLEVNDQTSAYIALTRSDIDALERGRWPAAVAGSIEALVDANKSFIADLDQLFLGQQRSASYVRMLSDEADALGDAEAAVHRQLSPPVPHT